MKVAIVTDSTCDWSMEQYHERGVTMVPLYVEMEDRGYLDRVELDPEAFYNKLASMKGLPKTSQPSPADFMAVYQRLKEEGYEAIVSIHISSKLSGTYQSAHIAAQESEIPVRVIDSLTTTTALGLVIDVACVARDSGDDLEQLVVRVEKALEDVELIGMPDTLENLVKGGRATAAQGFAAGLLNIKILVTVRDGEVVPLAKIRGMKNACGKMVKIMQKYAGLHGPLRARILHTRNLEGVSVLQRMLEEEQVPVEIVGIDCCGPVIGTHLGEGAVGISFLPASDL